MTDLYPASSSTPFVVSESDVDLFDSLEDLDCLTPASQCSMLEEASDESNRGPFSPGDAISHVPYSRRPSIDSEVSVSELTLPSRRSSFGRRARRCSNVSTASSSSNSVGSKSSYSFNLSSDDDMSVVSCLSTSRRSKRRTSLRRRSISFHERIMVKKIPCLNDMDDDELEAQWYRDDELAKIKQDASDLIKSIKGTKELPEDAAELRGLHMSKKKQRRQLWVMALSCVLDEQRRQTASGTTDSEKLAKLYKSFTKLASKVALVMGRNDEKAAQEAS